MFYDLIRAGDTFFPPPLIGYFEFGKISSYLWPTGVILLERFKREISLLAVSWMGYLCSMLILNFRMIVGALMC